MRAMIETRSAGLPIELRIEDGKPKSLVGYGAVFNSRSVDLGGWVEIIRPGAFKASLAAGADVRALVDHDTRLIIGRNKAGTLILGEDERGLRVEIMPPDTGAGRDVLENVRLGNLDGMSFAFYVPDGGFRWDHAANPPVRELLAVDITDVSVVAYPAYPKTEVALRSLRAVLDEAAALAAREIDADLDTRRRRLRLAEAEVGR